MNVLIIEDEKALARELEIFLANSNYICEVCFDGASASEKVAVNLYDFILIDLGLPDYEGLDLGADDTRANPFPLLELQSRMQPITRRKFGLKNNIIELGEFLVNLTD